MGHRARSGQFAAALDPDCVRHSEPDVLHWFDQHR